MAVPNTFQTATSAIPLANLDANFTYYDTAFAISGTAITFWGQITLSSSTANGVAYLNGSKVLTSGSALTFDGTNFATTGTATAAKLIPTGNSATGNGLYLPAANSVGISTNGTNAVYIDSSQNVGIGTSTPAVKLDVKNGIAVSTITSYFTSGNSDANFRLGFANGSGAAINTEQASLVFVYSGTDTLAKIGFLRGNASNCLGMTFNVGGASASTEVMRLDSSGNVGIGTNSPQARVHVYGSEANLTVGSGVAGALEINNGNTSSYGILSELIFSSGTGGGTNRTAAISSAFTSGGPAPLNGDLRFSTRNAGSMATRMIITESGDVGIGTNSVTNAKLKVSGANAGGAIMSEDTSSTTSFVRILGDVSSQNLLNWQDGTSLRFATSTQAYGTFNERMRIDSSGNLLVGGTGVTAKLAVSGAGNVNSVVITKGTTAGDTTIGHYQMIKFDNNSTTSQAFIQFFINDGGAGCGSITANGASTAAFTAFSDQRLKENITELPSQLANIMALRPVEFDYIESEGGGHQIGFIAQEVNEIYPDLVGEREDGMYTLTDMNKNDARLIKCIQEQQALITSLTARITALEST